MRSQSKARLLVRARYDRDLYSVSVTAMMHAMSCYIGPRYNGTRLYLYLAHWIHNCCYNVYTLPTPEAVMSLRQPSMKLVVAKLSQRHPMIFNKMSRTTQCHFLLVVKVWKQILLTDSTWWRHQMETFSALLAICAGNSPAYGEFPAQRPVTRNFDVFFDMRPNKWLSKQSWGWWFETPLWSLWRHRNVNPKSKLLKEF